MVYVVGIDIMEHYVFVFKVLLVQGCIVELAAASYVVWIKCITFGIIRVLVQGMIWMSRLKCHFIVLLKF